MIDAGVVGARVPALGGVNGLLLLMAILFMGQRPPTLVHWICHFIGLTFFI